MSDSKINATRTVSFGTTQCLNADCMDVMAKFEDKSYDLAIVDPPYGIGWDGDSTLGNNPSAKWANPGKSTRYKKKDWDKEPPTAEYFDELRRVSKKQIIWGGNYFLLPLSGGWVVWAKGVAEGMSLSDAELAWTNTRNSVKIIPLLWSGFRKCEQVNRIHQTQKPVKLYSWLLREYAEPGWRILDTHMGSGSSVIAALDAGFEMLACELDSEYFAAAVERIDRYQQQQKLPL